MSDPIAELLYTLLASQSETGRKNYSVEDAAKQIRQLMADKACDAVEKCLYPTYDGDYELGIEAMRNEAIKAIRKALEVSDENL
jgi:DNA-binding transcriptional regulator YiaG